MTDLSDQYRQQVALEVLRAAWDVRLNCLNQPGAGERIDRFMSKPTCLDGRVKVGESEVDDVIEQAAVHYGRLLGLPEGSLESLIQSTSKSTDDPDVARQRNRAFALVRTGLMLKRIVGTEDDMRTWMASHNHALKDIPLNLVESEAGLAAVVGYLEFHANS